MLYDANGKQIQTKSSGCRYADIAPKMARIIAADLSKSSSFRDLTPWLYDSKGKLIEKNFDGGETIKFRRYNKLEENGG